MLMNWNRIQLRIRRVATDLVIAALLLSIMGGHAKAGKKPKGPTFDPTKLVWPLPPEQPRLRFEALIRGVADVEPVKKANFLDRVAGIQVRDLKPTFSKPYGIAVNSKGVIFVSDSTQGVVFALDRANHKATYYGITPQARVRMPMGIAVDARDRLWVADAISGKVYVFDTDGTLIWGLGKMGEMNNPTGVAVDDSRHRAYVVDSKAHKVLVYDTETGMLSVTFGKRGSDDGEFNYPTNIALSPDGSRIYVADTMNFRIQVFSADYKFVSQFGGQGMRWGNFSKPKGISVDRFGNIYVVDSDYCNFQIFEPKNFSLLLFVGGPGNMPGTFYLPAGIHVDGNDNLYVVDQLNHRIQILKLLNGEVPAAASAPTTAAGSSGAPAPPESGAAKANTEPK